MALRVALVLRALRGVPPTRTAALRPLVHRLFATRAERAAASAPLPAAAWEAEVGSLYARIEVGLADMVAANADAGFVVRRDGPELSIVSGRGRDFVLSSDADTQSVRLTGPGAGGGTGTGVFEYRLRPALGLWTSPNGDQLLEQLARDLGTARLRGYPSF